ncbi:hypothetical protein [Yoonia maritima]|uniref:hypothetical protein n=1 Tax=Yoonia maritima TaxID=1435347 RepID=UPI000D0E4D82|nr:hypothetical protein [Yoonia maritima]
MEEISRQLLYQRLRNRVIELLEMYSSLENIASFGAYEMINKVDDWLPLDYEKAPKVFTETEKEVIAEFIGLVSSASDATHNDTSNLEWLKASVEWNRLFEFAQKALTVFSERGRFSEKVEEALRT